MLTYLLRYTDFITHAWAFLNRIELLIPLAKYYSIIFRNYSFNFLTRLLIFTIKYILRLCWSFDKCILDTRVPSGVRLDISNVFYTSDSLWNVTFSVLDMKIVWCHCIKIFTMLKTTYVYISVHVFEIRIVMCIVRVSCTIINWSL